MYLLIAVVWFSTFFQPVFKQKIRFTQKMARGIEWNDMSYFGINFYFYRIKKISDFIHDRICRYIQRNH